MPETRENTDFELSYGHQPKSNPLSIKSNQIYAPGPNIQATLKPEMDLPTMERFHSNNANLGDYVTVPDETNPDDFNSANYYDDDNYYVQPKGLNSAVDV